MANATKRFASAVATEAEASGGAKIERALNQQTKWIIATLVATGVTFIGIIDTVIIALAGLDRHQSVRRPAHPSVPSTASASLSSGRPSPLLADDLSILVHQPDGGGQVGAGFVGEAFPAVGVEDVAHQFLV